MKPEERNRIYLDRLSTWKEPHEQELDEDHPNPAFIDDYRELAVPLPQGPTMADVQEQPIRWLWNNHIPYGALTLIIGDPGLGKSQVTLDMAARVTRGADWPDGATCDIGNVILMASEDSLNRTIKPRLTQAGANMLRAIPLNDVDLPGGKKRMFSLKKDLDYLEAQIDKHKADVVVMDPLNGYLGEVNAWKESEVRAVLNPVCVMADRHDTAIIGVVHLNKDNTRSAIHRVLGSVAFSAVTRAMFAVAAHPAASQARYFVSVKQNYCAPPPTLGFAMVDGGGIQWDGQEHPSVTADSILAIGGSPEEKAEKKLARDFLFEHLFNGPQPIALINVAATKAAVSHKMLHHAKTALKIKHRKIGSPDGSGKGGYWEWYLP